jgi:hypothetical protein
VTCEDESLFITNSPLPSSLHDKPSPLDTTSVSTNESPFHMNSPASNHVSPWSNYVTAISGNSSIIIAHLACVWRLDPAAAAAAVDAVQYDIVCRSALKSSGSSSSSSSSSIVCMDVDAQSAGNVRHIWSVSADGSCHVMCASVAVAPSVSMSLAASAGGGGISSNAHVAVLPRTCSDSSRAAIFNGFAVTMWSYASGGLAALWKIGARESIRCLNACRTTCDVDVESNGQDSDAARHASHVVRYGGHAVVAASAGGGVSAIVTVTAAAKQLLVSDAGIGAFRCVCDDNDALLLQLAAAASLAPLDLVGSSPNGGG